MSRGDVSNVCSLHGAADSGRGPGPRLLWAMGPLLPLLLCLGLIALPIAGCGGGASSDGAVSTPPWGPPKVAGNADPADVRVINGWVTASPRRRGRRRRLLRDPAWPGRVLVTSGLDARSQESLPAAPGCQRPDSGRFHDRDLPPHRAPRAGLCGTAPGPRISFVIRDSKIAEWRRVGLLARAPPDRHRQKDPQFQRLDFPAPARYGYTSQGHIRLEWSGGAPVGIHRETG
jgi:hypothetical protein